MSDKRTHEDRFLRVLKNEGVEAADWAAVGQHMMKEGLLGPDRAAVLRAVDRLREIRNIGKKSAWELVVKVAVYHYVIAADRGVKTEEQLKKEIRRLTRTAEVLGMRLRRMELDRRTSRTHS